MTEQGFPRIADHIARIRQDREEAIRKEKARREDIEQIRKVRREDFRFLTEGGLGEALRKAKGLLRQVSSSKVTLAVTHPEAFPAWSVEMYALLFWNLEPTMMAREYEWDEITIHLVKDPHAKITGLKFPYSTSGLEKNEIADHLDRAVANSIHTRAYFGPMFGALKKV